MKTWIPLFSAGLFWAAQACAGQLACNVTPRLIEVGLFYETATVRVEGAAGPGSKVVIAVTGPAAEEFFKTKTRFGPIWLTAGKVGVSGVPSLFLRFSAAPVRTLLSREARSQWRLDEASLIARMRIDLRHAVRRDEAAFRAAFLALKQADGSYSFGNTGVVMNESGGAASFRLDFPWPRTAPPATYEVRAYEIRDGSVIDEIAVAVRVARTGFPAWIAGMAENRSALYGLTAILIAALAGFGIDFFTTHVFGGKRPAAH